jgi:hypothetical protein
MNAQDKSMQNLQKDFNKLNKHMGKTGGNMSLLTKFSTAVNVAVIGLGIELRLQPCRWSALTLPSNLAR